LESENFDVVQYKKESIVSWKSRAEYYHNNWANKHIGPFKATDRLVNTLEIGPNDLVLDLACGTGVVAKEVSNRLTGSGMIVGIDISRTVLSIAKSSIALPNKCFIEMDAEKMGFSRAFDKVACQFALVFFPNPKRTMRAARKVMTKDGKIGVVVHGTRDNVPYLNSIMSPISKYIPDAQSFIAHRFGNPDDLEKILVDAGFSGISIDKYTFMYKAGTFEDYWAEYFSVGRYDALRSHVFKKGKQFILEIRSEAQKLAAKYVKDGLILFPWEVLIATGHN
jgi:ubiquinone/menaquinone biosynthesis C-methylase UbiE